VEHPDWAPNPQRKDMAALQRSRRALFEEASGRGALMVMSHEVFPPFGTIVPSAGGHRCVREREPVLR
jgi:hypothetical protein